MVYYICRCMSSHVCLGDFFLFWIAVWPFFGTKLSIRLSVCSVLIVVRPL